MAVFGVIGGEFVEPLVLAVAVRMIVALVSLWLNCFCGGYDFGVWGVFVCCWEFMVRSVYWVSSCYGMAFFFLLIFWGQMVVLGSFWFVLECICMVQSRILRDLCVSCFPGKKVLLVSDYMH